MDSVSFVLWRPGGLSRIGSDPLKAVNDVVEESTNVLSGILKFAASLVAPEEDEGVFHTAQTHQLEGLNCLHVSSFLLQGIFTQ